MMRQPSCDRMGYPCRQEAQGHLRRLQKERRGPWKEIRVYCCARCSLWHLTSKKRKAQARRK